MLRHFAASGVVAGTHCLKVLSIPVGSAVRRYLHSGVTRTLFAATDKDLPSPIDHAPLEKLYTSDTDILLEQIHKAKSLERILELVSMHADVMNDVHICSCFAQVHDHLREKSPLSPPDEDLTNNQAFQALCNRAMKRARYLDHQGVLNVVKTLTKLHVPANTYVMQAMLKMLCSQINDMSISELTFLNFLLQKQVKNSLVDSLKLALPLVLQVQIDQQLDSENINEAVSCLKLACRAKLKPATIEKVVLALKKRVHDFTPDHAISVIYALLFTDCPVEGYMGLVRSSFETISDRIHEPPKNVLLDFVKVCRRQSFYYRKFFLSLSRRVSEERWELHECYELVTHLSRLDFFSPELLQLLMDRILSNVETVKKHAKYSLLTVTEFYSSADYHFRNLHSLLDILSSAEEKLNTFYTQYPHLYVKLISCWCMLGYFHEACLEKLLDENFLFSAWSSSKRTGRVAELEQCVCCLHWALDVNGKSDRYAVPEKFFKEIIASVHQRHLRSPEYPLTAFLETGLGGKQFFLSGVLTEDGHFIDHLLAMRAGNYPVALSHVTGDSSSNSGTYILEKMHFPEDVKIIPILVCKKDKYCLDPEILKSPAALSARHLSSMSHFPVVINYEKWYSLPEREKIPYLMHEIKHAIQTETVQDSNLCPVR